jgi:hypothetical protein
MNGHASDIVVEIPWTDALEEQLGSVPWWLLSAGGHAIVLLLLSLIVASQPLQEIIIDPVDVAWQKPVDETEDRMEPVDRTQPPDIVHSQVVVDEEFFKDMDPVEDPSPIISDEMEESLGEPDTDRIDMVMTDSESIFGLGDTGGGRQNGDPFAHRIKKPRGIPGRPGRPPVADAMLNRALEWLARHQERDGHWDARKFGGKRTDVGVTGLALLAFLGDGHTEHLGRYRSNVAAAVAWLVSKQEKDGCIGRGFEGGVGYHHAIAGLALAEAYGMARVPRTKVAAQKAVYYSLNTHMAGNSGWRYKAGQEGDMSVTGWFVMQLKSALVSGIEVDGKGFGNAAEFLERCTKDDGNYAGRVAYKPERSPTTAMTAVGLVCRQFMGYKRSDPNVLGAAEHLRHEAPAWRDGEIDFYYWYYGALGMYQMGRGAWREWGSALVKTLEAGQRKGAPEVDGSWDPVGKWCDRGGRVFSTALGALCLEVWYRYTPVYADRSVTLNSGR